VGYKAVNDAEFQFPHHSDIRVPQKKIVIFVDRPGQAVFHRYHPETRGTVQNRVKKTAKRGAGKARSILSKGPHQGLLRERADFPGKGDLVG
jgi:hypothetical protein